MILASAAFTILYFFTKDLVLSSLAMLVVSTIVLILSIGVFNTRFSSLEYRIVFGKTWKLLWACLPLCASALIQSYIINSPKYAIDRLMSSETQAVFNILFMPVFSINLVVMFIFTPLVAGMSELWANGKKREFLKILYRQVMIIVGFTIFAAICSYVFGCELLGIIYGVSLGAYKMLMMLLMLFGGIAALTTFMSIIVTIMRKQGNIIVSYVIALICSFLFSDTMVGKYGMDGAGLLYGILMSVILVFLTVTVVREFRRVSGRMRDKA